MTGPVIAAFGRMAQNEERWREYLRRISSGDRQGLAQLYDETSGVVYGLALRMLDDASRAADVVLEVYQQIWNSPKKAETESSVLAWLTVLTRGQALAHVRKPKQTALPGGMAAALPAAESVLGHERELVVRALALLEPSLREAIELAFFSGMKDVELAQALGISPPVIRSRISAGMRKLSEALKLVSSTEGNA
jgi:RNA polymerase sigma-70 factor (ECF subfamily)